MHIYAALSHISPSNLHTANIHSLMYCTCEQTCDSPFGQQQHIDYLYINIFTFLHMAFMVMFKQ